MVWVYGDNGVVVLDDGNITSKEAAEHVGNCLSELEDGKSLVFESRTGVSEDILDQLRRVHSFLNQHGDEWDALRVDEDTKGTGEIAPESAHLTDQAEEATPLVADGAPDAQASLKASNLETRLSAPAASKKRKIDALVVSGEEQQHKQHKKKKKKRKQGKKKKASKRNKKNKKNKKKNQVQCTDKNEQERIGLAKEKERTDNMEHKDKALLAVAQATTSGASPLGEMDSSTHVEQYTRARAKEETKEKRKKEKKRPKKKKKESFAPSKRSSTSEDASSSPKKRKITSQKEKKKAKKRPKQEKVAAKRQNESDASDDDDEEALLLLQQQQLAIQQQQLELKLKLAKMKARKKKNKKRKPR